MEHIWLQSYPTGMPSEVSIQGYTSLVDLLDKSAVEYGDKNAVSNMGVALSFNQLVDYSKQFAAFLQQDWQMQPGDRIAIMLPNTLQYYIAMFGALRAGLIIVNINPMYTKRELATQLKDSGARAIVVMANFAGVLQTALPDTTVKHVLVTEVGDMFPPIKRVLTNVVVKYIKHLVPSWSIEKAQLWSQALAYKVDDLKPVDIKPNDIAFLQYTGGTTGVSKGAMLSHANLLINTQQCITWTEGIAERGQEIFVAPLPLYHIFSLTLCCFTMLQLGGEVMLITNPRDIDHVVNTLKNHSFTMIMGINTLYNALNHHPVFKTLDFSKLKLATAGGMATNKAVANEWFSITGRHITEGYGLTEASPVVCINRADINEFGDGVGLPVPSTDVEIRDEQGKALPVGEVGELCVHGPQVMQGYWQRPEETAEVIDDDGWLKTGDLATIDATGYIRLVDRKKDMILVSGFNVYPNEVEDVIMHHPGVHEVAVIGEKVKGSGEMVKAFIVRKDPNVNEESIIAHCRDNLTGYKRPKVIEFVDELPKSNVGKVLRRKLREEKVAQ